MKRKSITVEISKTIQVVQFEPIVVRVAETAELEDGDKVSKVREKLHESVSDSVVQIMKDEVKRWRKKNKD